MRRTYGLVFVVKIRGEDIDPRRLVQNSNNLGKGARESGNLETAASIPDNETCTLLVNFIYAVTHRRNCKQAAVDGRDDKLVVFRKVYVYFMELMKGRMSIQMPSRKLLKELILLHFTF